MNIILIIVAGGLGLGLIACAWGPLVCLARRRHKFGDWYRKGLRNDERTCRTCGMRQYKENAWWQRVNEQNEPYTPWGSDHDSPLQQVDTSPTALTVGELSPWSATGTNGIEAPHYGELAATTIPQPILGPETIALEAASSYPPSLSTLGAGAEARQPERSPV